MGLTVLDAGVIIAILDPSNVHHGPAAHALTVARQRGDTLVLPASAFAECLVAPCRRGPEAVALVNSFVDALPARIEPASRAIASAAAELRARHAGRLRLPDALVVATAVVIGADQVITTDSGWPGLPVSVDVLAAGGLIRDAVRRSIGEPEPTVDPFRDWIGGSDAAPEPVDDVVYGS